MHGPGFVAVEVPQGRSGGEEVEDGGARVAGFAVGAFGG